jgi:hypothetical protein
MDIKIYYNGKLDYKHEATKHMKKAFWTSMVWLDCVCRNNRLPSTPEEKEKAHSLAMSFARGERRPY